MNRCHTAVSRRGFVSMTAIGVASLAFRPQVFAGQESSLHTDTDGLIVHKSLDGGDTAQREGWYWFGEFLCHEILKVPVVPSRTMTAAAVMDLLEPAKDGVFYRHPKLAPWNNPFDKKLGFSRDQMTPLVAAMGVYGMEDRIRRLWNRLPQDPVGGTKHSFNGPLKKFLWFNAVYAGDVIGPMMINLFRRSWNENPLVASDGNGPAGEQELARNVDIRIAASLTDRDDTGNDLNLVVMLLLALLRYPSGEVTAAAQRYAKNRGVSYGSFLGAYRDRYGIDLTVPEKEVRRRMNDGIGAGWKTDSSRVLGALRWYHRPESGANPALAELYAPIIRHYLE